MKMIFNVTMANQLYVIFFSSDKYNVHLKFIVWILVSFKPISNRKTGLISMFFTCIEILEGHNLNSVIRNYLFWKQITINFWSTSLSFQSSLPNSAGPQMASVHTLFSHSMLAGATWNPTFITFLMSRKERELTRFNYISHSLAQTLFKAKNSRENWAKLDK